MVWLAIKLYQLITYAQLSRDLLQSTALAAVLVVWKCCGHPGRIVACSGDLVRLLALCRGHISCCLEDTRSGLFHQGVSSAAE